MAWVFGIGIFLALLFAFPKKTMILVGILLSIALLVGSYFFIEDYLYKKKKESVKITIKYNLEICSDEYPLLIGIENESGSTLEKVSFTVDGKRKGHSKAVYKSRYSGYSSDKILEAGEIFGNCWTVPPLDYGVPDNYKEQFPAKDMIWSATSIYPIFTE